MVKLWMTAEQLITEGPFALICKLYKADRLSGKGEGTGKVDVLRGNIVIGYIPVLENGDLISITVEAHTQKVFVSFNEMIKVEATE